MIKSACGLIISVILLIAYPLSTDASQQNLVVQNYKEKHSFLVTLIAEYDGRKLSLWGVPFSHDKEGVELIKKLFSKNTYSDYKSSHSIFRINPASIEFGFSEDDGNIDSTFNDELLAELIEHYSEKIGLLVCYGADKNGVPFCEMYDKDDRPLNETFVRKGLAVYSKRMAVQDEHYNARIIAAEAAAKEDKVGVWVPFHFMLHTLSGEIAR